VGEQPPLKESRREDRASHPSCRAKKRVEVRESAAIMPPGGGGSYSKFLTLHFSSLYNIAFVMRAFMPCSIHFA